MTYVHDFGKDAFGFLKCRLSGTPGTQVELVVGEVLIDGRIHRSPGGYRTFRSATITLEKDCSEYELRLPEHIAPDPSRPKIHSPIDREIIPFRFAEISGNCRVDSVSRTEIFPSEFHDEDSFFHSNNETLNRIWDFCKYSMKATAALGVFIDGERERLPYEGDAYINQLGWFANCTSPKIPRRTMEHFAKHPTWPFEWRLLTPLLARDYLLYTGDRDSVRQWLQWLPGCLLPDFTDENGLIRGREGCNIRAVIDWPPCEQDQYEHAPVSFVPNALLVSSLNSMAELTGDDSYRNRARDVLGKIQKTMFRNGLPVDNPDSDHTALHTAVSALWNGICAPSPALNQLIQDKGMACSVFESQFLLDSVFENNMERYGLELLTSDSLRSWNNMLRKGATITMEAWDDTLKPNQDWSHAWGAAPANIIPRRICGIRPTSPGFRSFVCEPAVLPGLDWEFRHPTPFGPIRAEYSSGKLNVAAPKEISRSKSRQVR